MGGSGIFWLYDTYFVNFKDRVHHNLTELKGTLKNATEIPGI